MNKEELDEEIEYYEERKDNLTEAKDNAEQLIYLNQKLDLDWDFESLSNEISREIEKCDKKIEEAKDSIRELEESPNRYLEHEYWSDQFRSTDYGYQRPY